MSATYNENVRLGWKRRAEEIREPLKKQMKENLNADLDRWMQIMYINSTTPRDV